jgi:hypothetical protein
MSQTSKAARFLATALVFAAGTHAAAQFETRASISTGSHDPTSVVVGDFNRDGRLDIAAIETDRSSGNVAIFLGNGDGTFHTGASYTVAIQPFYAATASFRGNGILDLVVADSLSASIYVMLGNGDGTFQNPVPVATSAESIMVAVGDFSGDGKVDVLALEGSCCVEVLPGNGDGTFGSPVTTPLPYGMSGYAMAVAISIMTENWMWRSPGNLFRTCRSAFC